jgi:hypothetical protein
MGALSALQRRVLKLEIAAQPRPSPFVLWFGSFDNFVVGVVMPGIRSGAFDERDMLDIIEAFRRWEEDGTWDLTFAQ